MLTITSNARLFFKRILEYMDESGYSLRLSHEEGSGQFKFVTDKIRNGDLIFEHENEPVLLIDNNTGNILEGAVIDCEEHLTERICLTIYLKYPDPGNILNSSQHDNSR